MEKEATLRITPDEARIVDDYARHPERLTDREILIARLLVNMQCTLSDAERDLRQKLT